MITSGLRRMTVSIEMRGYSGKAGSSSTLTPPAIVDEIVEIRAAADGNEIGERAGATADDEQHALGGRPPTA